MPKLATRVTGPFFSTAIVLATSVELLLYCLTICALKLIACFCFYWCLMLFDPRSYSMELLSQIKRKMAVLCHTFIKLGRLALRQALQDIHLDVYTLGQDDDQNRSNPQISHFYHGSQGYDVKQSPKALVVRSMPLDISSSIEKRYFQALIRFCMFSMIPPLRGCGIVFLRL